MNAEKIDMSVPFCSPNCAPYSAPGSMYQYDLYWIVDQMRKLLTYAEALRQSDQAQKADITTNANEIADLNTAVESLTNKICSGDFGEETLLAWADGHMVDVVNRLVQFVFFGLTDDGHFVAYIPSNWDFLKFDTVLDPYSKDFGRLVIKY